MSPDITRLASAFLKRITVNFDVIAAYAYHSMEKRSRKTHFMLTVKTPLTRSPQETPLLLHAGNWDAKPGAAGTATWHILSKFAVGLRRTYARRHLVNWFSNDGRTRYQIDHTSTRFHWGFLLVGGRTYIGD